MRKLSVKRAIELYESQKGVCPYCEECLNSFDQIHVDHIESKANGGKNTFTNYALCCGFCNISKKDKSVEYIREYMAPYRCGIVKNKKDLREYHSYIALQNKFTTLQ